VLALHGRHRPEGLDHALGPLGQLPGVQANVELREVKAEQLDPPAQVT
jgi:hypothetical protein